METGPPHTHRSVSILLGVAWLRQSFPWFFLLFTGTFKGNVRYYFTHKYVNIYHWLIKTALHTIMPIADPTQITLHIQSSVFSFPSLSSKCVLQSFQIRIQTQFLHCLWVFICVPTPLLHVSCTCWWKQVICPLELVILADCSCPGQLNVL